MKIKFALIGMCLASTLSKATASTGLTKIDSMSGEDQYQNMKVELIHDSIKKISKDSFRFSVLITGVEPLELANQNAKDNTPVSEDEADQQEKTIQNKVILESKIQCSDLKIEPIRMFYNNQGKQTEIKVVREEGSTIDEQTRLNISKLICK